MAVVGRVGQLVIIGGAEDRAGEAVILRRFRDLDEAFLAMRARLTVLLPRLNERDRRAVMAAEAISWGRGGISDSTSEPSSCWPGRN
jgi:cyanophycinase-like exopeptidase